MTDVPEGTGPAQPPLAPTPPEPAPPADLATAGPGAATEPAAAAEPGPLAAPADPAAPQPAPSTAPPGGEPGAPVQAGQLPDVPATAAAPTPRRPRRWPRVLLVIALIVVGVVAVAGGGGALALELGRPATRAEVAAAAQAEVASRWQRLPAGQIFPARVSYQTSDGVRTAAVRVGIAPPASCAAALDPGVAAVVGHACRTVLRATYTDSTGTLVATLGIIVTSSTGVASRIESGAGPAAGWEHSGVRAVGFPGTVSAEFTDGARQVLGTEFHGPYIFLVAVGHTDGRPGPGKGGGAMSDLILGLPGPAVTALTSNTPACARKDITC